jgi:Uma2 family endonuclease
MTILDRPSLEPRVKRWTKDEYLAIAEAGTLEGQRVYLFRGEIIEMAPSGPDHSDVIEQLADVIRDAMPRPAFSVRVQLPIDVPGNSAPEPDIAVVPGGRRKRRRLPVKAIFVIEVAASSLKHDRDKALEYAAAGVEDYWIVDVNQNVIEVYRQIVDDASVPLGKRYSSVRTLTLEESIAPLAAPEQMLSVREMLALD